MRRQMVTTMYNNVYYLQQFCRVVNFFVVVSSNTNFRLNSVGESSVRGLKNFFKFSLKNKGIVILVMNPTGNRKDLLFV